MRKRMPVRCATAIAVSVIIASGVQSTSRASQAISSDETIATMVAVIESETNLAARVNAASALVGAANAVGRGSTPPKECTVARIASLLGDRDEIIRIQAAWALRNLGPYARSAVPELQRALAEVKRARVVDRERELHSDVAHREVVVHTGPSLEWELERALKQIPMTDATTPVPSR